MTRVGQAYGGDTANQPGDQSGGEVRVQAWFAYARGWNCVLRAKDSAVADRMAAFCEAACANDSIGYSQARRNTLRAVARAVGWDASKITTPCDCDCSSLMAVCAEAAGVDMDGAYTSGNAPWTGNMAQKFAGTGAFAVLTEDKYLTGPEHLRRGDILVNTAYHTLMVLDDRKEVIREKMDESKRIKRGDVLCYTPGHGVHFTPTGQTDPPVFWEAESPVFPAVVVMLAEEQEDAERPYLVLLANQAVGWVSAESLSPLGADEITEDEPLTHTVAAGDTLWGIAVKYGVSMQDVVAVNGMKSINDVIYPGDVLIVPTKEEKR